MKETRTPWLDNYGDVPAHLKYSSGSLFDLVKETAEKYPDYVAYDFMGDPTTYSQLIKGIEECAKALKAYGMREGDKVTICMPNCPQAIMMFYAINLVGGIANMIHPLSGEKEIEFYLNDSESLFAITLDQFYGKFEAIRKNVKVETLIIARIYDALPSRLKFGYAITQGRKIP